MHRQPLTNVEKISNLLLITAMEVEENAVLRTHPFEEVIISKRLGVSARKLQLGAKTLWLTQSGIGSVNAALTLSSIYEHHPIDAVILLGVGGAVSADLKAGDLVIAHHVLQHDSIYSAESGTKVMAPGALYQSLPDTERTPARIATDPVLTQWLAASFTTASKDTVHKGTVLSGAEFVASTPRKLEIASRDPNSLIVDMEACGVAQVSNRLGLPFAVAKTVADRLQAEVSLGKDYLNFLDAAAHHAGELAQCLIREMSNS